MQEWRKIRLCVYSKQAVQVHRKKVWYLQNVLFSCWPGSDFPPEVKGNVRGDGYVFKLGVILLFRTKSGQLQLLLVQLLPWAPPDTFLSKICPNTGTGLTQYAVNLNWHQVLSVSLVQHSRSNDSAGRTREVTLFSQMLHWSTEETRPRAIRCMMANPDNQPTCLCSDRKRRLALASTVTGHDVECVLSVRTERLEFSWRGRHCILPEKAVVVCDSYDVMSGPTLQAESHHQSCAVLWLHFIDGIHHLRG